MFEQGQMVNWYKPGATTPLEKEIAKVIPQKPILAQYIEHAAVLIFTDGEWAFSWNVYPGPRKVVK